jgi:penicillin-binding protein 1A
MAGAGNRRGRLVADKRYAGAAKPAAKKAAPKTTAKATKTRRTKSRPKRQHGLIAGFIIGIVSAIWRVFWGITWRLTALGCIILGSVVGYFYSTLPDMEALLDARARGSVTMLDREGKVFAWRGETYGGQISSATVSENLRNAVIATEDKRFYGHLGVSPRGIASAIRINLSEGRGPLEGNGGSTITQQVAKLLCLGVAYDPAQWKTEAEYEEDCRGGGIVRKLKEIPYAIAMELKYSKEDILTIYFNRAYLGAGARGFEAASQRYFDKSAKDLTPSEGAMLAGLLKAPSRYAPTNNLKRAQDRAAVVIGLMQDQGYLTADQAADALSRPAKLSPAAAADRGGYFADWIMKSGPDFLTRDTTEDVIAMTTLDQRLQTAAEEGLAAALEAAKLKEGSKAQFAVVVMSADGAVRAMIGGRNLDGNDSFNRATQAVRQTGSAFKPFVYAAAMDLGYSPSDYVQDTPLCINIPGSGEWCPVNYDKKFKGMITLTQSLAESRNVPAVRISEAVGRDVVRQVATQFGIGRDMAPGPALALGASEATLVEMTGAYAGILNGGQLVKPYGLAGLRLQGDDEPLFEQDSGMGERVISETAAQLLTYMMTQVVEVGTGKRAQMAGWQVAGKTGTTSDVKDAWFVGYTSEYVTGVWMGYDDNTPMEGISGGGLPAGIWREVMTRMHEGLEPKPLPLIVPEYRAPPNAAAQGGGQPQYPVAVLEDGTLVQVMPDGSFVPIPPNDPIADIMRQEGVNQ